MIARSQLLAPRLRRRVPRAPQRSACGRRGARLQGSHPAQCVLPKQLSDAGLLRQDLFVNLTMATRGPPLVLARADGHPNGSNCNLGVGESGSSPGSNAAKPLGADTAFLTGTESGPAQTADSPLTQGVAVPFPVKNAVSAVALLSRPV
jgi:hypothetical protein